MEAEIAERLDWTDVEAIVKPIINVWTDGAELRWGAYAWQALSKAGLTSYSTELDRVRCLLRALSLGALGRDFYARAFDEGYPDEWREYIDSDLIGPPQLVDAFTLGQLAEREGVEADNSPFDDGVLAEVLRDLVGSEYRTVASTLRASWGDDGLFASLFASVDADSSYPLTDEAVAEVVNDATAGKMRAWEWLTDLA